MVDIYLFIYRLETVKMLSARVKNISGKEREEMWWWWWWWGGSFWKRKRTKTMSRQTHRREKKPSLEIPPGLCVKAKCVPQRWMCEMDQPLSLCSPNTVPFLLFSSSCLHKYFSVSSQVGECHVERTLQWLLCMCYDNKVSGFRWGRNCTTGDVAAHRITSSDKETTTGRGQKEGKEEGHTDTLTLVQ